MQLTIQKSVSLARQLRRLGIALLINYALPAAAELGGNPIPSPATPAAEIAPSADTTSRVISHQAQRADLYTVQAQQLPTGTVVREYIALSGKVFAVVWEGPVLPDLQQVLGAYFPQYLDAAKNGTAGRGALHIEQPDLVVQSSGRMRAFFGRAYVPQLVPQDITLDAIQ